MMGHISSLFNRVWRYRLGYLFLTTLFVYMLQPVMGGEIVAWGDNKFGQIEPAAGSARAAALQGNDYVAVAAGSVHSLALRRDGTIAGWGNDTWGQATAPAGNDFVAIAAGEDHSLALRADGSLFAWGNNWAGQTDVPAGNDFIAIAAGYDHCLALREDGSIVGWGYDGSGQIDVPVGNDFVAISAFGDHSLALRADGSIAAWGTNAWGQSTAPAGNDFVAVAAGVNHSVALRADGSLYAWGSNSYGQATPPAGNDYVAIASGGFHSIALRADRSIVVWGNNAYHQTEAPAGNDFVDIAGGYAHSLALKSSVLMVALDVKPGSYPNRFNLRSMGVVPAAILGSETFDAATVDPATVTLNEIGIKTAGKKGKLLAHIEDVNGDGLFDFLFQIDSRLLQLEPGEIPAVVEGQTYDGYEIMGEDTLSVVDPGRKGKSARNCKPGMKFSPFFKMFRFIPKHR